MTDTRSSNLPWAACALVLAGVGCAGLLLGCSETSLNEAPIIDLSSRAGANQAVVRASQEPVARESSQDWYAVQKGDTLFHIAAAFHCTMQDLARWNGIEENTPIFIGQRLRVRAPAGTAPPAPATAAAPAPAEPEGPVAAEAHAVPLSGTGAVETRALEAVPAAGAAAAPGVSGTVTPVGAAGVSAPAAPAGGAAPAGNAEAAAAPLPAEATAAPRAAPDGAKTATSAPWIWPVEGRVTTTFDPVHSKGIEMAVKDDAKIVAVADGEVSYTGSPRDYGNLVIVRHPDGLLSVYAHNKTILVTQGQAVKRGQAIATAGRVDGASPNLHFEVRRKGVPVNPMELLPAR